MYVWSSWYISLRHTADCRRIQGPLHNRYLSLETRCTLTMTIFIYQLTAAPGYFLAQVGYHRVVLLPYECGWIGVTVCQIISLMTVRNPSRRHGCAIRSYTFIKLSFWASLSLEPASELHDFTCDVLSGQWQNVSDKDSPKEFTISCVGHGRKSDDRNKAQDIAWGLE